MSRLFELISELARDTSPDIPGLQPSILYVAISLIVPVAIGLLIGLLTNLLRKRFGLDMPESD